MEPNSLVIRRARANDRNRLRAMQAESMRILAAQCYSREEIEAFLTYVGTMDDQILEEGTYYLAETGGHVVASGGWSRVRANYTQSSGTETALDPAIAKIRSVFVRPDWARHGLGRRLTERAESEAWSAGFNEVELNALLSGVPFYRALGYRVVRPLALSLPDELLFRGLTMRKTLTASASRVPDTGGILARRSGQRCCEQAA